jgi:hypothetical protein
MVFIQMCLRMIIDLLQLGVWATIFIYFNYSCFFYYMLVSSI